ncbi:MAG TPA: SCO family protein [Pyrinomonadaceae bacterium]|jgi:cytochrome oxidase Cu insertion factor (SCO1/SenC/PrrC family)|nr:SCO family protein [Pyrinomonadaceae bacterium]
MPKKKSLPLTQMFICAAMLAGICLGPLPNLTAASAQTRAKSPAAKRYACPMHPEVTSTKPRKCPKCGMTLRLVETTADDAAAGSTPPANPPITAPTNAPSIGSDDSSFASSRIPDTQVFDQNGKRLNFYSDLIKGKTVAINFIFTTCTTICPPLTATFRKVQQDLATTAPEATLISISVDPTTDNPHRLNDFAAKFNAGPGWTFVTGEQAEITALLRALGAAVGDKNDHTPMILIGNDATGYWTRAYGLSSPTSLVKSIVEAANHK